LDLYCGIDWAEGHHDIAIIDSAGVLRAKRRITDDAAGYRDLMELLADHGDTPQDPVPVAIETSQGLLVAALRAGTRKIYAVNPLSAARYRDRHGVSKKKSDPGDALVLANILRTDAHAHRPLPADTEQARAITVLARAQQDAVWARQQTANQLRSVLRQFYPALLQAGAVWQNGLARPEIRELLRIAPTPGTAARLSTARIETALRRAGRSRGITPRPSGSRPSSVATMPANPRPSKTPWGSRRPACCSSSTLPARPSTSSAPQSRKPSLATPMPRSCSASPGSATSWGHGSWPRSETTGNGSRTPAH
jgi:hypothetical protein